MKRNLLEQAAGFIKRQRNRQRWYKVFSVMAAVVVFVTTYALILPAITMERPTICGMEAHVHTADCYVRTADGYACMADLQLHTHDDACYDEQENLVCGYADFVLHTHDPFCYDANGDLVCPLDEVPSYTVEQPVLAEETTGDAATGSALAFIMEELHGAAIEYTEPHTHSEDCYDGAGSLVCGQLEVQAHQHDAACFTDDARICGLEEHQHTEVCYEEQKQPDADTEYICGLEEHIHCEACYDENGELICGLEEHQHSEECYGEQKQPDADTEYICGLEEHAHGEACYGENGELICGLEEHQHGEECVMEKEISDDARVQEVIAMIDALPTSEEVEARLTALDEAGDEDGYEAYFAEILHQVREAYLLYEDIGVDLQSQVVNADKLLAFDWLYSAQTFELTNMLTVYQVNCFNATVTTLAYSDSIEKSVQDCIKSGGWQFTQWKAIVVESSNEILKVKQIYTDETVKSQLEVPEKGFIIITQNQVEASVGDTVSVDFDYTKQVYNSSGLGTVTFQSAAAVKPVKDNSDKLTIVPGANTRDLIEVNLYDYGTNINEKYNSDHKYPGFQQEKGSTNVGDSFSKWQSFNFGNNITSDLAAGIAGITNAGGAINTTTNGANSPISGAIQTTLGEDGYPALADGMSLRYLFSNNQYATKKNSQSINGLFQYHADTGAYTFNSRENHAQFNEGSDTFTLYDQIISSNFMMYPFGNFLPFNDIVHLSAQTSTIDKSYLETIANSAQYKFSEGAGEEYGTLATQLKKFITLMDNAYPDGWTGTDCMNEYFKASGIPRTFTQNEALVQKLYSIDYDEPTDFYFGMEMKMNFMQPKGGLTGQDGQQPMVFYFTGDDDVWVYIDGKLFLDLSGIHRHVGGEIDFVNGEVKYYDLDVSTGDVGSTPSKTVKFSDLVNIGLNDKGTFTDYSTHSFNFYYMERGAGSGVCRMNFNFPLLRQNSISVTKELSVNEADKAGLLGNPDFKFQVLRENGRDLFIGADTNYAIYNAANEKIGTGTTDANGLCTIKAGQTAVFTGINENTGKYFVRELLDSSVFEQYGMISVDGSSVTTNYDVTVGSDTFKGVNSPVKNASDGSTMFHFNNQVAFNKTGSLDITKNLLTYPQPRTVQQFQFEVTLDGAPLPAGTVYTVGGDTRTVETAGVITLAPGETAHIANILAGTEFTVQETAASSEGYYVSYSVDGSAASRDSATGRIGVNSSVTVTVQNSENGVSVEIPISKTLEQPDGAEHHYKFSMTQVTDQTGKTDIIDEAGNIAFERELEIAVTDSPVSGKFIIDYPQTALKALPATYYYKIVEKENPDEAGTQFDTTVYIVEVTVSKDAETGVLSAGITSVWKDGEQLQGDSQQITFTNRIMRYELPQTGGPGTTGYILAGLLLMAAAAMLLYKQKQRGREEL